jgi:hypothetical protein
MITENEMAIFFIKTYISTKNFSTLSWTFCNLTNRSIVFKCHCLFLLFFFLQRSTTNSIAKKSSLEKQTVKLKCLKKVSQNLKVFFVGMFSSRIPSFVFYNIKLRLTVVQQPWSFLIPIMSKLDCSKD